MAAAKGGVPQRLPARTFLAPEQLASLRQLSEWKGFALVVHAWAVIFGAIALVALFPNPLSYILAVMLIGSRQLGLAILMHEGAHRCFSRNEGRNLAVSQWFCAYPIFADTLAYRRDHEGQLSAKVLARYHWPNRLRAEEGSTAQCVRGSVLAHAAAAAALQ
jgi:fatty acid desaturase